MVIKETQQKKPFFKSTENMSTIERVEYYMAEEGLSKEDAVNKAYAERSQIKKDSKTDDDSKFADLFTESVDNSVENVKNSVCSELSKIGIKKPDYKVTYTCERGIHRITVSSVERGYLNSLQFTLPERSEVIQRLIRLFVDETKGLLI